MPINMAIRKALALLGMSVAAPGPGLGSLTGMVAPASLSGVSRRFPRGGGLV